MRKFKLFIVIIFIYSFNLFAQYQMSLSNDVQTNSMVYEFDVFVKSTAGSINLTSYQLVFTFNTSIANGGNLSFSYISGSSGLSNTPTVNVGITNDGGTENLVAGSNPGSDNVSTTDIKVGRFRITNTVPFSTDKTNIAWDFAGGNATEVNIDNADATNSSNHVNNLTNSALPVELSSFSALVNVNNVSLHWKTATEVNNNGFEIQRKADSQNSNWEKVGFVHGHGNSNSPKEYSFTDKNLTGGTEIIYRLKQIDNDGKYEYSKEAEVKVVPTEISLLQNYPNPFNPVTEIKFTLPEAAKVTLRVYNIIGQEVANLVNGIEEAGFHSVKFEGSDLPSGTYIYRLQTGSVVQTKKMVLLK